MRDAYRLERRHYHRLAVAAYFWANRLFPVEMAGHVAWELHTLFAVWGD